MTVEAGPKQGRNQLFPRAQNLTDVFAGEELSIQVLNSDYKRPHVHRIPPGTTITIFGDRALADQPGRVFMPEGTKVAFCAPAGRPKRLHLHSVRVARLLLALADRPDVVVEWAEKNKK